MPTGPLPSILKTFNSFGRLDALTGVRFIAAFHVFIFHAWAARGFPAFFRNVEQAGGSAVAFFFVLSGFILCVTYGKRGNFNIKDFAVARLARIYPLYSLAIICSVGFWLHASSRYPSNDVVVGWIKSAFLVQNWFTPDSSSGTAWSLSVEAFFYLIFPLLLIWVMRQRARVLAVTLMIVSVAYAMLRWTDVRPSIALVRLPDFVIGIIFGRLYLMDVLKGHNQKAGLIFYSSFLATILIPQLLPMKSDKVGGFLPLFFGLIILSLAEFDGLPTKLMRSRLFVFLGGASYALYLFHPYAIYATDELFQLLHRSRASDGLPFALTAVLIAVGIACLLFVFIEEPSRDLLRRRFIKKKSPENQPENVALKNEPI